MLRRLLPLTTGLCVVTGLMACVPPGVSSVRSAGSGESGSSFPGSRMPGPTSGPSTSPSNSPEPAGDMPSLPGAGPILAGILSVPALDLISNNSGNLTYTGGGVFFRIQNLASNPSAGARLSLVDAGGTALSDEHPVTDAGGRFAFRSAATSSEAVFVAADFQGNGKDFTFQALVPSLTTTATVDVDVASTLVAAKMQAEFTRGSIPRRGLDPATLRTLVQSVRSRLIPAQVPFMARNSRDLVPALEQLIADQADLADAAAAVASPLKQVMKGWRVGPRATQTALIQAGVVTTMEPPQYAVDSSGNLLVSRSGPPGVTVNRVSPTGQVTGVGTAPLMPPHSCFVSAGGEVLVTGIDVATRRYRVARLGASTEVLPGYLFELPSTPGATISAPNLDLAMDGSGNLFAAFTLDHVIVKLASGSSEPTVIAGVRGERGYRDGTGSEARFSSPRGLARGADGAIYVADHDNSCIRRVEASGKVTTVAGKPGETDPRYGRASFARFGTPDSVAMGADGTIYVLDTGARRVSRISPDGSVFLVAGSGREGNQDGVGPEASFVTPLRLRIDGSGRLYVLDRSSSPLAGSPTPPQPVIRSMVQE